MLIKSTWDRKDETYIAKEKRRERRGKRRKRKKRNTKNGKLKTCERM